MPDPGAWVPASVDCGDNVDVADPGLVAVACAGKVDGGGRDTCRSLARCPPLARCFNEGIRALCAAVEGQGGGNGGLDNAGDDGSGGRGYLLVGDTESFMSTSSVLLLGGVPCVAEGDWGGVLVDSYRTQSA